MLLPRTLARSIAAEVSIFAGIGFLAFIAVLLIQNLAQSLDELVAVGMSLRDASAVVIHLVGMVSPYAVPVGFLFGVLAAVGRLSADSEVTAMRACGLGLGAIFAPVTAIALLLALLTGTLMIQVEPAARKDLRRVLASVASRGAIFTPGRFRTVGDRVLYIQSRDVDDESLLKRIFIADRSNPKRPFLIFAQSARFRFDPDQLLIHLEMENGDIHLESLDLSGHQRIAFEGFDYTLDASALIDATRQLKPSEMDLAQLAAVMDRPPNPVLGRLPSQYRAHFHRRLAIPFAPFVFAALGVPLGLRRSRAARSWGVLVCIVLVAGYYTLLGFGQFMGETGRMPAAIALWLPNLVFGLAAIPLLRNAQRGMA
ncbi:MAG: LptF/LptG family permease, partial [Methylococcaceae bacterium]|nr:LptF/LptG family permease [Methylococcaceae bacterium]